MPASERSVRITDNYRQRLTALRRHASATARHGWSALDGGDLDGSHAAWVARTSAVLHELQRAGARLSAGYLIAFLTSERGRRLDTLPPVDPGVHAGAARDGRPIAEALAPTLVTVKMAIGEGRPLAEALSLGANRAVRVAGEEAVAPARAALADGIRADERIVGWQRVTSGGCGACIAAAGGFQADDEPFEVHDGCQCTSEPVVADAPDAVPRPTGQQIFDAMSSGQQDALLGADKANLIRSGAVPLLALIEKQPMAAIPDQITERPLEALHSRS